MRRFWPLLPAFAVLSVSFAWIMAQSLSINGSQLILALDDPYIEMAVARNLVEHGVWGVSSQGFTSSCSTLLFPLLIAAAYAVTGVGTVAVVLLNLAASGLLIVLFGNVLRRQGASIGLQAAAPAALVLFANLPTLAMIGMEHSLHALLQVATIGLAAAQLSSEASPQERRLAPLCVSGFLLAATRFESLATLGLIGAGFCLQRRWREGLIFVSITLAPIAVYGVISRAHGWFWLPNSVLVKAEAGFKPSGSRWAYLLGYRAWRTLLETPFLLLPILLTAAMGLRRAAERRTWRETGVLLALLSVLPALAHVQFGLVNRFYRFEAYLIAPLWVSTVWMAVDEARREGGWRIGFGARAAEWVLGLAVVLVQGERGARAIRDAAPATRDIHLQHHQMARFVLEHYPDSTLVLNDIGFVHYLTDARVVDLMGLGSLEAARLRRAWKTNTETIGALAAAEGARIAIVYENNFWNRSGPPEGWSTVARWTMDRLKVAGGPTVAFQAIGFDERERLARALAAFSPHLPHGVTVEWVP